MIAFYLSENVILNPLPSFFLQFCGSFLLGEVVFGMVWGLFFWGGGSSFFTFTLMQKH